MAAKKNFGTTVKDAMMNGIGYMIPVVVAGALIKAIGNLMAGTGDPAAMEGTLANIFYVWGGNLFGMMNYILAMFTAHRIGSKMALVPGLVAGIFAATTSAGFLGAVIGGLIAGYLTKFLNEKIKLSVNLTSAKTLVIIPFITCLVMFPIMHYVLVPVCTWLISLLTGLLNAARGFSPFLLGGLMSMLVAVGMGSAPGWASFAVAMVILEESGSYIGFTAMTTGGACCNLGIAFAILLAKKKFTPDERAGIPSLLAGWLVCVTEMEIPYALNDPKRVFPAVALGGFVGGGLVMQLGVEVPAIHGGMIVAVLANNLPLYILCILATALITMGYLILTKPNLPVAEEQAAPAQS